MDPVAVAETKEYK